MAGAGQSRPMPAACPALARRTAGASPWRRGLGWGGSGINWKHCGAVQRHVLAARPGGGRRGMPPWHPPVCRVEKGRIVDKRGPRGAFPCPKPFLARVFRPGLRPFNPPEAAGIAFLTIKFVSRASSSPSRHISARIGSANRQTHYPGLKSHALTRILGKMGPLFRARSPRKVLNREEFSFFLPPAIGSLPATMSAMPDGKTNQRTTTLRPLFQGTSLGFGPGPEDGARIGRTS